MAGFGGRDLALALSAEVGDAASLRHTKDHSVAVAAAVAPKRDASKKVLRYRAGQAPSFATDPGEEEGEGFLRQAWRKTKERGEKETDRRLERLERSRRQVQTQVLSASDSDSDSGAESDASAKRARLRARRRVVTSEVVEASASDSDSDDAPDSPDQKPRIKAGSAAAAAAPRVAAAAAPLPKQKVEGEEAMEPKPPAAGRLAGRKAPMATKSESSSASSESGSDETDSDSSDDEVDPLAGNVMLIRPKFVPKEKRKGMAALAAEGPSEAEAAAEAAAARARLEERRRETRRLVALEVQREAEAGQEVDVTDNDSEAGMPDDQDLDDDEVEYEKWKVRELRRLVRDRDEAASRAEEARETERRRHMTDEEILREDRARGKLAGEDTSRREGSKQKYMQRYYHKGAFFMDEDSIQRLGDRDESARKVDVRKRDYTEATGFDKFDTEAMPDIIAKAKGKFGLRGQTKYTHLTDQDTTDHRSERIGLATQYDRNKSVFDASKKKRKRT